MYCIKCGVELADSERKCPLCLTPVYYPGLNPDPERPYPDTKPNLPRVNKKVIYLMLSFLFLIAAVISLIADLNLGGGIIWSGYVLTGLALAYLIVIFPAWFPRNRRTPAVFAPCDFAAVALFLWYVCYATGGNWFLTFGLPVTGGAALISCAVIILCYYIRRGYLYIFGGACIATGLFTVLIEWLVDVTFKPNFNFIWSPYPAISLGLVGIMLIIIAIVKPFRDSLYRIFSLYPPET